MEICLSFPEDPDILDYVQVKKKIGEGKFNVYQVYSQTHKAFYALKAIPKTKHGVAQYNKSKLMFHLNHPNIIQSIPITCQHDKINVVLTEYIPYGNFHDIVSKEMIDSEILARTYFRQLIEGLEYIHLKGIAHLDLKLDNLMLGSNFQLKIIDFDQAQPIKDEYLTSGGTKDFRAPEVINGECNDLTALDIYSAGIILFTFKVRELPFCEVHGENPGGYDYYVNDKSYYWKFKGQLRKERNFFSHDFIELVNGMIHEDVSKRFKIKHIKESKWYKGPVLSLESLKKVMRDKV